MTDLPDWNRSTAGATKLVASASGLVVPSGGTFGPINFSVPSSTRSVLVLLLCTNAPAGGVVPQGASMVGATSKQIWASPQVLPQLDTAFHTNTSAEAIYFPFYGLVDQQGSFSFNISGGPSTWEYWIMALPDADILGSAANPVQVQESPFNAALTQLRVITPGGGGSGTLLNPPNTGQAYRIKFMSIATEGTAAPTAGSWMQIKTHNNQSKLMQKVIQSTSLDYSLFTPCDILIADGLDYVASTGTAANVEFNVLYSVEQIY